jgi:hypothetical protein
MGKYSSLSQMRPPKPPPSGPHAVWRGIGCLMILIIPAISISAAMLIVDYGLENNWPIPYELRGSVRLPEIFYSTEGLRTIFNPISNVPNLYAIALLSLILMILLGGVISVIYAAVYGMTGPSRYGPTDAPPAGIKVKKYKR